MVWLRLFMADTSHPLSPPHLLPLSLLQPTPAPPSIPRGGAGNNWSRCRCGDGPGAGVAQAAGPPTPPISDALIPPPPFPPTSFPSPRSRRRRQRRRYPAALATMGTGAAAAMGPEPAPPTTGACCRRIWGRGNKNTVAYPVAEQDIQKRVQSSRRRDESGSAQDQIE